MVKADNVSPIPKKLSIEQAEVMPSDALTALRGLDEILKLKKGESPPLPQPDSRPVARTEDV